MSICKLCKKYTPEEKMNCTKNNFTMFLEKMDVVVDVTKCSDFEKKEIKPKVINILGAPGVGKSVLAARVFSALKVKSVNIELVTEFMKRKIWEENNGVIRDQLLVFATQRNELMCAAEKVNVVVSDGPLITELIYNNLKSPMKEHLNELVWDVVNEFDNVYYLIEKKGKYHNIGRLHHEDESDKLYEDLKKILDEKGISYKKIDSDDVQIIVDDYLRETK